MKEGSWSLWITPMLLLHHGHFGAESKTSQLQQISYGRRNLLSFVISLRVARVSGSLVDERDLWQGKRCSPGVHEKQLLGLPRLATTVASGPGSWLARIEGALLQNMPQSCCNSNVTFLEAFPNLLFPTPLVLFFHELQGFCN